MNVLKRLLQLLKRPGLIFEYATKLFVIFCVYHVLIIVQNLSNTALEGDFQLFVHDAKTGKTKFGSFKARTTPPKDTKYYIFRAGTNHKRELLIGGGKRLGSLGGVDAYAEGNLLRRENGDLNYFVGLVFLF